MKFYQFCALVLLACSVNAEVTDESKECEKELEELYRKERQCRNKLSDMELFQADFNASIIESKGHDNQMLMIQEFLNKYCAIMFEYFECSENIQIIAAGLECEPIIRKLKRNIANGIKSFVTDMCANNAEMFKKLLPHDGFEFVFFNRDFQRCHYMSPEIDNAKDYCIALNTSRSCMLTAVGDHENKDIAVLANGLIEKLKSEFEC